MLKRLVDMHEKLANGKGQYTNRYHTQNQTSIITLSKTNKVRMRFQAEKGVPDSKPSKCLAMVIRSRVNHCGFHSRLER
jgi:hypothetical protein